MMESEMGYLEFETHFETILKNARVGDRDSDRHGITLFATAIASRAKTMIELGVRAGDTTLPLLMAARFNGTVLHSVDKESTSFASPKELDENWLFHKMDALDFLAAWESDKKGRIDFIYIDDWHSYSHVKSELEIIDRLVGPSSVILIHDLMYGNTEPFYHSDLVLKSGQWAQGGPYRAVCELNENFWEFATFPWSHGLTLVRKKYSTKFFTR